MLFPSYSSFIKACYIVYMKIVKKVASNPHFRQSKNKEEEAAGESDRNLFGFFELLFKVGLRNMREQKMKEWASKKETESSK